MVELGGGGAYELCPPEIHPAHGVQCRRFAILFMDGILRRVGVAIHSQIEEAQEVAKWRIRCRQTALHLARALHPIAAQRILPSQQVCFGSAFP